ncbi:MAG TPA: hypothetical protein ENK18_04395 [Deltaproteobacteria bacterium]|nr:hypothetical protein [Deltaproteobacteria bacterium]
MGIEPFLLVFIIAGMFFVQAGRALSEQLRDRLSFSLATVEGARQLADRQQMSQGDGGRCWHSEHEGLRLELHAEGYPARRIGRLLAEATGVRQRRIREDLGWLAPSILVLVWLPEPVAPRLLISQRPSVVPKVSRIPLHNPVLDQLLRVQASDPARARALLAHEDVHGPLIELLGRHPLSVVTGEVVALWYCRAVADPQPLVDLALEVAGALRLAAERLDRSLDPAVAAE